jgi:hypothetical protein
MKKILYLVIIFITYNFIFIFEKCFVKPNNIFNNHIKSKVYINNDIEIDKKIFQYVSKITNKKILKYLNLEDYEYISPEIFEPTIGIQAKIDIYEGMCFTYCIIYLQLRIMNPDLDRKLIIKYLMTKSKKEMIDIILKYAKYIENTLKANSEDINKSLVLYSTESTKKKYNYMIINYKNEFFFFDHFNY